ncbi:hypothetical protein GBA52_025864 [Prunus armeniaca]|nr:hypothetical protein GBA52_025864 [Prunus armeniaca]
MGSETLDAKPFSTAVGDGDEDVNDNSAYSSTMVESECDFDADAGKNVEFELEDSARNLSNCEDRDDDDEGLICDSMMVESENGDDNVSSVKPLSFVHVASREPAELYRELRNAEKGAKQRRSDWDSLQEIFRYFGNSGWASDQSLAIYIGRSFFPTAVHNFRNFFFKKCSADVASQNALREILKMFGSGDCVVAFFKEKRYLRLKLQLKNTPISVVVLFMVPCHQKLEDSKQICLMIKIMNMMCLLLLRQWEWVLNLNIRGGLYSMAWPSTMVTKL